MVASKYDIYIPSVKWLHSQKKTDQEIATCVGIDSRRVADIRKKIGVKRNNPSECPISLNGTQKQMIIGGIVGDMCIFKDKRSDYHRMNVAHSIKQKQYLLYKSHLLGDLFSEPKERKWIDSRTKNEYHEIRIQSRTHKIFSDLYRKWYRNGKKVIHDDIWDLDNLGLAIIYFDDGWKTKHTYEISLEDYTKQDIDILADVLQTKFNLDCTVPARERSLYIKTKSAESFREIIKPFITKDTEYKL